MSIILTTTEICLKQAATALFCVISNSSKYLNFDRKYYSSSRRLILLCEKLFSLLSLLNVKSSVLERGLFYFCKHVSAVSPLTVLGLDWNIGEEEPTLVDFVCSKVCDYLSHMKKTLWISCLYFEMWCIAWEI